MASTNFTEDEEYKSDEEQACVPEIAGGIRDQLLSLSVKGDLHGTTLSHATSLRQVYDTNCFV